jgi:CDP-glycerol glycerophosphotransferase
VVSIDSAAARLSVIVPIFDVAPYLEACLESLERQTMSDFEVIMVDDGSNDESPEIAERFAERDARFRLLHQPNAGQGAARNTGLDDARGEFVAFVDSDDVLPHRAYEGLLGALDRTGSDFATGNVHGLTSRGTGQARFLAAAFERERLQTHITRFPALVADRLTGNKVLRRSFWDRHGLRFPEGVRNEDILVMMPAHYLAESVDVVAQTVYLWRRREEGVLSGTQRRVGTKALRDRMRAVDYVSRFLAEREMWDAKLVYDRNVLGDDLRFFVNLLDNTDDEYRQLFLDLTNEFLDRADTGALEQPLAIDRLKWHLVRCRALPELLEVLRFQEESLRDTPPVRRLGRWYGDYPYWSDRRLRIPRRVYRLDDELALTARVNRMRWEGQTLRIEGYAYVTGIGAPRKRSQRVEIHVREVGSKRQFRLRAENTYRPDVAGEAAGEVSNLDWCGFVATLNADRLRLGDRSNASWEVAVVVRAGGVSRTAGRILPAPLHPRPVAEVEVDGANLRAGLTGSGAIKVRLERQRSFVRSYFLEEGVLQLDGDVGALDEENPTLLLRRREGGATLRYPVHVLRSRRNASLVARVPFEDLGSEGVETAGAVRVEEPDEGVRWDAFLVADGRERRLLLHEAAPEQTWPLGNGELAVHRTRYGGFTLAARTSRAVVTGAKWSPTGSLVLTGSFHAAPGDYDLVLSARRDGETHTVPLRYDAATGRFTAELTPARIGSLAGVRPLPAGRWDLLVRPRESVDNGGRNAVLGHRLLAELPMTASVGGRTFHFGVAGYDTPVLEVDRDLEQHELGAFRQRRLRTACYPAARQRPVQDAVLYDCFGGREYSDSPRAVYEELLRRGAPYEHLWVVRDGAFQVPESARAVRELSEEYYDAYARARYIVASDPWPKWATRRPEQTWLQTWHGAPLKRLGCDLAGWPRAARAYRRARGQPGENWQLVVSPAAFATSILRRAFPAADEVVETGLPRTDILFRSDREQLAENLRRRLGLAPDQRIVLYAPTYRDHVLGHVGYRIGSMLDLRALHSGLGEDYVVLFRKHRLTEGTLPADVSRLVLDVSDYPDSMELLLVADVLVTDYSSAIFDFASTGRLMVFFTPDLEAYRDEIRGFSIDFESVAPGPLLRTTDEVIEALRQPEALHTEFAQRYERFVEEYCPLNDGGAASRVVDRVFTW